MPKLSVKTSALLFSLFFLAAPCLLHAESPNVSVSLDKRSAEVNDEIHLTLRVTGSPSNIQAPRLPQFPGFETFYTGRASHMTFINGIQSTKVEFSYILISRTAGRFTLEPIEVVVNGQAFRTSPIDIEIAAAPGGAASGGPVPAGGQTLPPVPAPASTSAQPAPGSGSVQEPEPVFRPDDDNIFIQAWLDKNEVYPNQQVLLTYSLHTRYDTRYEGFAEEPEISGFWIEEFPMERDIRRDTVRVNGKRYIKADIRKIALFPTTPSDYTIKPGSIKVSIRQEPQSQSIFDEFFDDSFFSGSGFFSRRENRLIKPEPLQLKVIPFPEAGKPADFQGAVGNFKMTGSIDKKEVNQNEPVTMTVVIEGEGNIETIKQPALPELKNFKIYEADSSSELFKTGSVIGGRKNFEIVFIPTEAGEQKIPTLSFSFFNPFTRSYQTLTTAPFTIHAKPSEKPFEVPKTMSQQEIFKKEIEVEGEDIRFIQETLPDETAGRLTGILYFVLAGMDALLTLLILFKLWRDRTEKIFAQDTALMRRKRARALAESKFGGLKRLARSNMREDSVSYFEEVDKVLTQFLSDKFDLSAYGTTREDIESVLLRSLGPEDSLFQNVLEAYRICDESRFAGQTLPHELKTEVFNILKQTIARVDKLRR